jgi:peptidoglycan-associated lipoprotein
MRNLPTLTALVAIATLLGACSSTPVTPPAASSAPTTPAPAPRATPPSPAAPAAAPAATAPLPAHLDPSSPIARERSVYFDFDDFSIKPEYAGLVQRHAAYLSTHPTLSIKVEGNADERGSSEYNLALGQKRAEAVVKALRLLGVRDAQMEAISWGEEKPVANGHDEASWAKNRRADLQYPRR